MSEKEKSDSIKIVADNRQARFLYEILETYEAGIELFVGFYPQTSRSQLWTFWTLALVGSKIEV